MTFKCALVTGATSGIGNALSHLLADKGIDLILTGRNVERLAELKADLGATVKVVTIEADLAVPKQRSRVVNALHKHVPDLIINNAGFGLYGDALTYDTAAQVEMLRLNGEALLELSLEGARALRTAANPGVICNISSIAAFFPFPTFAVYAATKEFVNAFSRNLDFELQEHGIRVLAACPGRTATEFQSRAAGKKRRVLRSDPPPPGFMSVGDVVDEIWQQIEQRQQLRVINWRYRLMSWLPSLLPKKLLAKRLRGKMDPVHANREFIATRNPRTP